MYNSTKIIFRDSHDLRKEGKEFNFDDENKYFNLGCDYECKIQSWPDLRVFAKLDRKQGRPEKGGGGQVGQFALGPRLWGRIPKIL